jgi:hypothetical protein
MVFSFYLVWIGSLQNLAAGRVLWFRRTVPAPGPGLRRRPDYHTINALEFAFRFQLIKGQPDAGRANFFKPA